MAFFIPCTITEESLTPVVAGHEVSVISTLPSEAYSKIQGLHVPITFKGVIMGWLHLTWVAWDPAGYAEESKHGRALFQEIKLSNYDSPEVSSVQSAQIWLGLQGEEST